jgi:iron complex transport system substrate-binding protein
VARVCRCRLDRWRHRCAVAAAGPGARWATPAAAILLLALLPLASAEAFTVQDPTGRTLTLPAPPRRIVSLVPSVTETMFAIGAERALVGVTDFCNYPPAATRKPRVGGMLAPSLETIVTLKPDLVVATTAGNREETFAELARLGIPVYVVNPTRLADVVDLITRLGALTAHEPEAARLVASLGARVDAVARRVAGRPRPRVLYVLWPDPLIVPARGALVSELLVLAGADSVTAAGGEGYPRYSLEAAVAGSPEVIILASHSTGQGPIALDKWERFTALPAVKAGRVHTASGDLLHRYGPRVVDGLEQLARLIHPEAFGKVAGP